MTETHPVYMKNKTYHLCMDDRKLSVFTQLWLQWDKPCGFSMRNAASNVKDSIVVSIKDEEGNMLDFIARVLKYTSAKVAVS